MRLNWNNNLYFINYFYIYVIRNKWEKKIEKKSNKKRLTKKQRKSSVFFYLFPKFENFQFKLDVFSTTQQFQCCIEDNIQQLRPLSNPRLLSAQWDTHFTAKYNSVVCCRFEHPMRLQL